MAPTVAPWGLGLRGTGNWVTDQRPMNWRNAILRMFPNGSAPLTAILSALPSERTTDPQFHWWEKALPTQGGTAAIYEDALLSDVYDDSDDYAAGTLVYAKMTAAVAAEFRPGHVVMMRTTTDYTNDVRGKVMQVVSNGASSYLTVKLLEADGTGTGDLSDCDWIQVIGNLNPEGGVIPDAISYDVNKLYNLTQIFRTPVEITRTARLTTLRTGDALKELERDALELHSIEIEKALLFGIRTENTGSNGKPERTTWGLLNYFMENASDNVDDYSLNAATAYSGKTWLTAGKLWMDTMLELIFRYGSQNKMALCGSGAILGLNRLAETYGDISLQPGAAEYGIAVTKWTTPFGSILLKTHPLFSYTAVDRNRILLFEPQNLKERYISQTHKKRDDGEGKAGFQAIDGVKHEFLTEIGLEIHHACTGGVLSGVGVDNEVT